MPGSSDPTKRSKVSTRARLLEAAFEVFAERGFDAATVEEICEAAGFTRGAYYSSFDRKEELFFALWSARAADILEYLAGIAGALPDAPDRLEEAIDHMVRGVARDRRWFLVSTEFMLYAIRHPDVASTLAEHREGLRAGLSHIIATVRDAQGRDAQGRNAQGLDTQGLDAQGLDTQGLDTQGVEGPSSIDVDLRARMVIAAIEGCQHQIWVEPDELADGHLQVAMVRQLLR